MNLLFISSASTPLLIRMLPMSTLSWGLPLGLPYRCLIDWNSFINCHTLVSQQKAHTQGTPHPSQSNYLCYTLKGKGGREGDSVCVCVLTLAQFWGKTFFDSSSVRQSLKTFRNFLSTSLEPQRRPLGSRRFTKLSGVRAHPDLVCAALMGAAVEFMLISG